jgi:hypothetical protein
MSGSSSLSATKGDEGARAVVEGAVGRQAHFGVPGTFSDLRGGPSTVSGTDYQLLVTTAELIVMLDEARFNPLTDALARVEPRQLVTDGQYGFDFGWTRRSDREDEIWEVKKNPSTNDVREFVANAVSLVTESSAGTVRLIAGSPTAAFRRLEALIRHGSEATSEEHLRALVAAAGDSEEAQLLGLLGSRPLDTLSSFGQPSFLAEKATGDVIDQLCRNMAVAWQTAESWGNSRWFNDGVAGSCC